MVLYKSTYQVLLTVALILSLARTGWPKKYTLYVCMYGICPLLIAITFMCHSV